MKSFTKINYYYQLIPKVRYVIIKLNDGI